MQFQKYAKKKLFIIIKNKDNIIKIKTKYNCD